VLYPLRNFLTGAGFARLAGFWNTDMKDHQNPWTDLDGKRANPRAPNDKNLPFWSEARNGYASVNASP
jgi:hypothetical protein